MISETLNERLGQAGIEVNGHEPWDIKVCQAVMTGLGDGAAPPPRRC